MHWISSAYPPSSKMPFHHVTAYTPHARCVEFFFVLLSLRFSPCTHTAPASWRGQVSDASIHVGYGRVPVRFPALFVIANSPPRESASSAILAAASFVLFSFFSFFPLLGGSGYGGGNTHADRVELEALYCARPAHPIFGALAQAC